MKQTSLFEKTEAEEKVYDKADALSNIRKLYKMWKLGLLGGEFMPEDSNPHYLGIPKKIFCILHSLWL